jgi:AraC family transcriptional regulator of adaptative response/methylated-DNA-[protein]-cysteine methyltransferase
LRRWQELAVSPFHFHRLFKSVTGMTPKAWQQAWRARRLREALEQGKGDPRRAGGRFPDSSSYYRQADAALGMTARQFRRGGDTVVPIPRRLRAGSLPGGAERTGRLRRFAG